MVSEALWGHEWRNVNKLTKRPLEERVRHFRLVGMRGRRGRGRMYFAVRVQVAMLT